MSSSASAPGTRFGPLEAEVMDVVWAATGPVSVRDVAKRLNDGGRYVRGPVRARRPGPVSWIAWRARDPFQASAQEPGSHA